LVNIIEVDGPSYAISEMGLIRATWPNEPESHLPKLEKKAFRFLVKLQLVTIKMVSVTCCDQMVHFE
jgi:hypothetical protein